MAAARTERLMNLLIMLLVQRGYVGKERIRDVLYRDSSGDAFEKMFERDKEELRSLGVPIEVGTLDGFFADEPGYRISADDFGLPPVRLTSDEAAVVGLATRVWSQASMASASTEAVRKLTAAGVEVDTTGLDLAHPTLSAEEESFELFVEATRERREVHFDYRTATGDHPVPRRLQPWGVVRYGGRWYVAGHDLDREAARVFRLSRVHGEARATGPADAYTPPADADPGDLVRRVMPAAPTGRAVLLVRSGHGHALRRHASRTEYGVPGPDQDGGWDRIVLERLPHDLIGEILSHGASAFVEEPADLREDVIGRLRDVVG